MKCLLWLGRSIAVNPAKKASGPGQHGVLVTDLFISRVFSCGLTSDECDAWCVWGVRCDPCPRLSPCSSHHEYSRTGRTLGQGEGYRFGGNKSILSEDNSEWHMPIKFCQYLGVRHPYHGAFAYNAEKANSHIDFDSLKLWFGKYRTVN